MERRIIRRRAGGWVYTAAVLGVLVLLNILGGRFVWRYDATREQKFSLAPQTREVLANLPGEVKAIGFFTPEESGQRAYVEDLLREYAHYSKGKFTFELVDPAANPSLVKQYNLTSSAVTVLVYQGKQEQVDQWDMMAGFDPATGQPNLNGEQALTNALIRLTAQRKPKLYFLDGYGGKSLLQWEKQLKAENYVVENLNLITKGDVPADADLLVLAGPTRDLQPRELELLDRWLDSRGGRMAVLVDPGQELPNLTSWLQKWGVTLHHDLVVDPDRHYMYDPATPVPYYGTHLITSKVDSARLAMVLPGARSMTYAQRDGFVIQPLLTTSQQAWGETTLKGRAARDGSDVAGPLTMGVAVTRLAKEKTDNAPAVPEARLVVIGSSGFAADDALTIQGNLDFAMAMAGWLVDQGESVTIRAKQVADVPMFFTQREALTIFLGTVVVMPALFLMAGGAVWYRRRHL
jgi:ABC-type uncharacterized transport system involved in gliding motility auxiliary subunit